ncbi:metallophosphoesterase [Terrimonas sp. NA20]|uniref:Metallophosphoesterase n=1 Tax=Terrimonas ginsenosidimutans TaxID=2908004 RepID=A0ABS9KLU3_9BACT|nr:metallophosphoesterase [Terrimonas ginsenosidimutans]MCG2613303.1 metallophosphoesterase [Terrimonas ginsenosidimutans]
MKSIIITCAMLVLSLNSFCQKTGRSPIDSTFSFVLMSDIHIKPEVTERFQRAIDTVNKLRPDFVMAAGDLVYDVMRGNPGHADSLFNLYKKMSAGIRSKVYNCIGNHELFGIYPESDVDSTHPGYKYGMYEKHIGKTYYSFDHKGWHFIVLNSIDVNTEKAYFGGIDKKQLEWLKQDIAGVDKKTPVALTVHIPFLSSFNQLYGSKKPLSSDQPNGVLIFKGNEVLDLFSDYNLRLVMQGHVHWIEDVFVNNKTHFLTAGSVAGRPSWSGTRNGERGFMEVKVKGEEVSWRYVEYEK